MNDTFLLKDWKDVSRVKNFTYPSRRVRSILQTESGIPSGWSLEVYDEDSLIYKFDVDSNEENSFSLTTSEAVRVLNLLGFNVQWNSLTLMTDAVKPAVISLNSLGYENLIREVRPNRVLAQGSRNRAVVLSEIYDDFNYRDWLFLDVNDPTPVGDLLDDFAESEEVVH